ncbi:hypothetical protein BGW80DRAFT_734307 [Lactifluus volemus]|nr:hypothetical protein BGW80DRAFT_734307 [Lactifluus volemus]
MVYQMESLCSIILILQTFPPAKAICAGIGILLAAIKDVSASYDALIDLFESIENFLRRLDIYTKIPSNPAMTEIIVKILIEILCTLSIATKHVKEGRFKKFGKKLLGDNEVEAVLQRLDRLTQEEARATAAQTLQVVYSLVKNLNDGEAVTDDIHQALVLMQQIASEMNKSNRDQLQESFRRWLSPPDPSVNDNLARDAHHEGTAEWFIQGDTFQEWKQTGSLLWIRGNPGCGKSVLCSTVTRDIKRMSDAGLASLAYFYLDFKDTSKQNARALLASILVQCSAQSDACCNILSRLHSAHKAGSEQPNDEAMRECLREMLATPCQGPLFIVIDALDECPQSAGTPSPRERVLDLVKWLVNLHLSYLHICVTSRPEMSIQAALEKLASHTVSLHGESGQTEDINKYIESFINSDPRTCKWRKQDQQLVITKLCERAGGMFRWVSCQLDKLRRCLPQRIRRALDELPTTLDETYERTLLNIDEEKWEFAHRLFQCVTVASRPLRVEELGEFLAFDFDGEGRPIFEEDWRPEDAACAVLSTCSSMISVIKADDHRVVQFSHFSVKEFLTSTRIARGRLPRFYVPLEMSHTTVVQACLFILLQIDNHIAENRVEKFPLARYAARHWVDHAKFGTVSSHRQVGEDMRQLFNPDKPHFAVWTRIYDLDSPSYGRGGPLYYSALCGFHEIADWLVITCSQDVNARAGSEETPLMVASKMGFLQVVQLLLKHGANPNITTAYGHTPLWVASYEGYLKISQLLIEYGGDVNTCHDRTGHTSLHVALEHGHVEIAKLLLESNANPNPEMSSCLPLPPLHTALAQGHPQVVQLLLHHSANPHARGFEGETLLHMASRRGDLNVVQQLLELGADVHVLDDEGWTPFQAVDRRPHQVWVSLSRPQVKVKSEVEVQRDKDAIRELLLKYGSESPRDPTPSLAPRGVVSIHQFLGKLQA